MALQIVYWNSLEQICCNQPLPVDVVICTDPTFVAQQGCAGGGITNYPFPGIAGQLVAVYTINNDCNRCPIYRYTIGYNDAQLVPDKKLVTADIGGLLCLGCMTTFVRASAGNDVFLTQNEDGSYTLTSQHGCEYTFVTSGVSVEDTDTIDLHLVGVTLSADVKLSGAAGNQIVSDGTGLFVPPSPGDFIQSITDTISVDLTVTGSALSADVNISAFPQNILLQAPDGLFVSESLIQGLTDTSSVHLGLTGSALSADVLISADAGNQVIIQPDGLFVPAAPGDFIDSVTDTASVDLTVVAGALSADTNISAGADNQISIAGDGLFVPIGAGFTVTDTNSVDLTLLAGALSADSKISATGGNAISVALDGLLVNKGAGVTVSDSTSINLTATAGDITAVSIISATANNQISIAGDGLLVPQLAGLTILDTNSIDLVLSAPQLSANSKISATSGNAISIAGDGLYVPSLAPLDTWVPAGGPWSFIDATHISVPAGADLIYACGDKIKFTQSAIVKYFYVLEVNSTNIQIPENLDNILTNNPITLPFYSKAVSPIGFQQWFIYQPVVTGFTVNPTNIFGNFALIGGTAFVFVETNDGTSNSTNFTVTVPIPANGPGNVTLFHSGGNIGTNDGVFTGNVYAELGAVGDSIVSLFPNSKGSTWVASGSKGAQFYITYPALL